MSDAIKKIDGWVDDRNLVNRFGKEHYYGVYLWPTNADANGNVIHPHKRALLLVSTDDKVPEVMTMDQVRAMLADLKDQTMSMAVEQSIDRIAAKHGITP